MFANSHFTSSRPAIAVVALGAATVVVLTTVEQAAASRRPAAVFVAPDGSDSKSCRTRRAACATFNRAYQVARPGHVVEAAAGRYPSQQIVFDPSKRSKRHVVFRPARGARVVLWGLALGSADHANGPRHVTIRNMRTAFVSATEQRPMVAFPGTRDVTWHNLDAGNFYLRGVRDFVVRGGDWGPCWTRAGASCSNSKIDAGPSGHTTRNVLVSGALFHDYRFHPSCFEPGGDCHFECMLVNGSANVTIRGSRFRDCALYDIFVTLYGQDAAATGHRNLTIENNWFDIPWHENPSNPSRVRRTAVSLTWCQNSPLGYRGVRVRFNSFHPGTGVDLEFSETCALEDVRLTANLLGYPGWCDRRVGYAYNVWSSAWQRGRCHRTDRVVAKTLPYAVATSGKRFDYHLKKRRTTAADNAVPRSVRGGCPQRDIDGQRRPLQRRCDAGSDERRTRR